MFFGKKKTDPNEYLQGEVCLMRGEFRWNEAVDGRIGYYVIPGGFAPLLPGPDQAVEFQRFHTIICRTIEQLGWENPIAVTLEDRSQHNLEVWNQLFPSLKQVAMKECQSFLEDRSPNDNRYLFVFEQLSVQFHEELYRCINMDMPYEDIDLTYSVLPRDSALDFSTIQEVKDMALLNLYLDWDHLVFVIQAAPNYPIEKFAEQLANACMVGGWTFSDHTKK